MSDTRFKRFKASVVAQGKSYECELFALTAEDASAQAEKDAPPGTTSITVEPALKSYEQPTELSLDIDAALNKRFAPAKKAEPVAVFAPVEKAPKPIDLGAVVNAALAAKDRLIANLTAELALYRGTARK